MNRSPAVLPNLHLDFVTAIREAWQSRRTKSVLAGAITWSTEDDRTYAPARTDYKRLIRLASNLHYDGPIFQ